MARHYIHALIGISLIVSLTWIPACRPASPEGSTDQNDADDGATTGAVSAVPAEQLRSTDLTYEGAFRLPDEVNWGARGMCFYAAGSGGAGSLLVTGFELLSDPDHPGESCWDASWDCGAWFGEVSILAPAQAEDWHDLPAATLVTPLTQYDGGLAADVHREYVFVEGIVRVPRQGSQTGDKLYGSLICWYPEGVFGEDTFPTVWMANTDGSDARGLYHVGPQQTPFHGRKMGAYLFTVPEWYANEYLGGRTLITGRSRGTPADASEAVTTRGGSQGPTLFAFAPWDSDDPTGDLDALPMLYYRVSFPGCAGPNVGDPANCDYPDFTMCDEWTGGAFVENETRRAIMLLGFKGLGKNCYDEPPVTCSDPCSDSHGYHCHPYERQVIFYDVHSLGQIARGQADPWTVTPYEIWRPTEFYLGPNTCWNAGGMAFDAQNRRVFMAERGLDGDTNAVVIHVWSL